MLTANLLRAGMFQSMGSLNSGAPAATVVAVWPEKLSG